MLVFLFVLAVFVVVAIGALALRNRTERGIQSGISSFRRELDALAPRGDPKARSVSRLRPGGADEADDAADDGSDEEDDDDVRTVQIGNKPPPRRLSGGRSTIAGRTPSPASEPDPPESTGSNDAEGSDTEIDEPDVERADGS